MILSTTAAILWFVAGALVIAVLVADRCLKAASDTTEWMKAINDTLRAVNESLKAQNSAILSIFEHLKPKAIKRAPRAFVLPNQQN